MTTRIGLIGLGGIAEKAYLPVLTALDMVEIVAVMSRRTETVNRICRQYRLSNGVTELAEFLRAGAEAAMVLTPSATHFRVVQFLLGAGLDVLVEKPATLSSRETAALGELAEKRKRILMVGFNRRYSPLYRQAKDLFASHHVALWLAEKHRASAAHASLLANYIDDTIHLIDLARWFGGEGHAVTTCSRLREGKLVDAVSTVAFDAGGIGIVATSLEAGGWQERVTLHGEQLTVEVEAFRELRVVRGDRQEIMGREVAGQWTTSLEVRGFVPLIRHFVDCVANRQTPETNALEAYKTQVLLEEMVARVSET
jgi:virulence factor